MTQALLQKVSQKTGVPVQHLVGPLAPVEMPARSGLFVRISPKTGDVVYSMVNPSHRWGLYSDTISGAQRRSHKMSKKSAQWFGVTEAYSKGTV